MLAQSIITLAFMAGAAIAQSSTASSSATATASGSTSISTSAVAAEVPINTKSSWCISQQSVCSTLCSGTTNANTCDPNSLTYNCLCSSNSSAPGLEYYLDTLHYNICQRAFSDCIAAHPNDASGQSACKTNIQDTCGSLDSTKLMPGGGASSSVAVTPATPTSASSTAPTGTQTSASAASTTTRAGLAAAGAELSFGFLASGLLAAFGFML